MRVTVSRKAHFNAAHRLYRKDWSMEKNQEVFGKCNNPNFHGHNYELIVSVTGEINTETGYVIDVKELKEIIVRLIFSFSVIRIMMFLFLISSFLFMEFLENLAKR